MRLLYLTDTHIRSGNPRNRCDDFGATLRAKLREVGSLVRTLGVSAVLHGGDFFDQPCPEIPVAGEFVRIFREMGVPLYVVPGNHDIFACNPDTLEHTMLGLLHQVGCLRVLQSGERVYLEDAGVTVQLTGTPFHYNIDRQDPLLDYCVTKENCDFAIHLAHGMLLDKPFFPGTPHTLIGQIAPFTEADYTLGSHAHFGYPDVEVNGRWFINPGSLVRLSTQPRDRERIPQVLVIDFSGPRPVHQKIKLRTARPGDEVIVADTPARAAVPETWEKDVRVAAGDPGGYPALADTLEEVARREGFPLDVVHRATRLLCCIRPGPEYLERERYLRRLVLENFQSHRYTDAEFAPGLNVIVGESSQGKSAVVRALQWLFYNEAPANAYIRAGAAFSRVTGVFDDQTVVCREDGRSNDGGRGETGSGPVPVAAVNPDSPPPGERRRRCELPRLVLDNDRRLRVHIASEQEGLFLLPEADTLKARALDRLSGADHFEAARREAEKLVRAGGQTPAEERLWRQAGTLLSLAAVRTREETCRRIEEMVNRALGAVFDQAPEFVVLFDDQSREPRAEFLVRLRSDGAGGCHGLPGTCGGGVADVVSLALRVAFLELMRPPWGGPLVLDEPARQVSSRYASHVARLLKSFSDSFRRQVIVVTHTQHLAGTADAVFVLRLESGTSVLHGRGSSIRASSKREESSS